MCSLSEKDNSKDQMSPNNIDMPNSAERTDGKFSFSTLLELAADNDVEGFKQCIENTPKAIDEVGLWYGRQVGSRRMFLEYRTPLMVAASHGSVDVLKFILSLSEADVNLTCSPDKSTALHCAAFGGSVNAVDVIKLLLLAGADPNIVDAKGSRPFDVINVSRMFPQLKIAVEDLLSCCESEGQKDMLATTDCLKVSSLSISTSLESKILSSSLELHSYPIACDSNDANVASLETPSSPIACKTNDANVASVTERKEYPVDPSLPDIKNSIYGSDEFRMYSFKVKPCSRAYSHDWTECPFVHPGENARRRDPRKFHYSCQACPELRKGSCKRGDLCEYAHGVFECWLHPAQYRTRLCKDGTNCARRVCFFAHTLDELRPLYVSSGSGVASPRSATSAAAVMDMAALNMFPGSPSAAAAGMSPSFSPMSPSGNGMSHLSGAWPQQNTPPLLLPGSSNIQTNNLQISRLRSSLHARDIPAEELSVLQDLDLEQQQFLNDMSRYPHPQFNPPCGNLSARSRGLVSSNNHGDLYSVDHSSPRYGDQFVTASAFSPSHKTAVLNHFQQQQSMLSPINTRVFLPKGVNHPHLQTSYGPSSPGVMSPRGIEPHSPLSARLSDLAFRERQQLRSLSSRELGANLPRDFGLDSPGMIGSPVGSWSNWDTSNGKPDWSVNAEEFGQLRRSFTFENGSEEPDVSWVKSLVKDSPSANKEMQQASSVSGANPPGEVSNSASQAESADHAALGAWLNQLQLDRILAS